MNKKELYGCYITTKNIASESEWNKITDKLVSLGFTEGGVYRGFEYIKSWPQLSIEKDDRFILRCEGTGLKEIKVSDILGEDTKFEVGKWYSFYWNWGNGYDIVAKVRSIKGSVYFDNFVNLTHGNTEVDQSSNAIILDEIENIKELSLEEIQRYLPEGHKDKLPKKLTIDDLVEGEIYYFRNDYGEWILLFGGNIRDCKTVRKQGTRFTTGNFTVRCAELRLATPEEKHWLITSIKQNKFIPQSELDKYDERGNLVETDYLNVLNIEVRDIVKCVSDRNVTKFANSNGAGWESDLEFIVTKIDDYSEYKVYFGGKDNNGVFSDAVRLVERKETEQTFEFNKWYKDKAWPKMLFFIKNWNTFYGFNGNGEWVFEENDPEPLLEIGWIPATIEGVQERLISYAKEKYPIGTKYKCLINKDICEIRNNFIYINNIVEDSDIGILFDDGQWAEIISKPTTETKTFDRNWYVEVSSQEEADLISDWLKSQGEKVNKSYNNTNWKYFNCTFKDVNSSAYWSRNHVIYQDTYQKQLSDILPNYSKVNRNVYYEVENQEQYLEILDWLESEREFISSTSRMLDVTDNWKYVVFNLSILDSWALDNFIPNLPKAEFQFKSRPGLREQINPEYIFPVEDLKTQLDKISSEIGSSKPAPEVKTEIKFISSEEDPQIEMPKLKVITNKIDLLTLKN